MDRTDKVKMDRPTRSMLRATESTVLCNCDDMKDWDMAVQLVLAILPVQRLEWEDPISTAKMYC